MNSKPARDAGEQQACSCGEERDQGAWKASQEGLTGRVSLALESDGDVETSDRRTLGPGRSFVTQTPHSLFFRSNVNLHCLAVTPIRCNRDGDSACSGRTDDGEGPTFEGGVSPSIESFVRAGVPIAEPEQFAGAVHFDGDVCVGTVLSGPVIIDESDSHEREVGIVGSDSVAIDLDVEQRRPRGGLQDVTTDFDDTSEGDGYQLTRFVCRVELCSVSMPFAGRATTHLGAIHQQGHLVGIGVDHDVDRLAFEAGPGPRCQAG